MLEQLPNWYDRLTLRHPVLILVLTAIVVSFFAYHARNFRLDASAESSVLKNDPALQTYRTIRARYGSDDFLVLTYAPKQNLFKQATLTELRALRDQLSHLQGIASVVSILDVPLIRSPPVTLSQLAESVPTLEYPKTNKALAQKELRTSPLYRNLLISPDGTTTALKINVRSDENHVQLLHRRDELRNKRHHGALSSEERAELAKVSQQFNVTNSEHQARLRKLIGDVRAIKDKYAGTAEMHLAGVPLIIADSIDFIRHDLVAFGIGVLAFLIVILAFAFRKPRWGALPLLTCLATGVVMIGYLGLVNWPVTVISANFPSLLLIITLSLSVHLIVRYREVHAENP